MANRLSSRWLAMGLLGASVGTIKLLATLCGQEPPPAKAAAGEPARVDAYGDPLPEGAIARLGTVRLRHGGFVEQAVFAPDEKSLVSRSRWEGVRVWDIATGRELRRYPEKIGPVMSRFAAAISPDGRFVVMVEGLGELGTTLSLRDIATGNQVRTIGEAGTFPNPTSVRFSPDGKLLAVVEDGSNEPTVGLWDVATGQRRHLMKGHKELVTSSRFTADGKTLITGGGPDDAEGIGAGRIILWDVDAGKQRQELAAGPGAVYQLAVSADGRRLASLNMIWVQTGPRSAAGCSENRIRIWDLDAGKELRQLVVDSKENEFGQPNGFGSLLITPDGKTLLTSGPDQFLRVWDMDTGRQLRQLPRRLFPLAFSPGGKTLGATTGSPIHLIDWATGKEANSVSGPQGMVTGAAMLPDGRTGRTAATIGSDGLILVWDLLTGRVRSRAVGPEGAGLPFAAGRDGRTLFSVAADETVRVWDLIAGKELRKWPIETNEPPWGQILALSLDGKDLALARERVVLVYDPATGKERHNLRHTKKVVSLAFTAEATLTVCTADHSVHVWDLATGKRLEQFDLPLAQVTKDVREPLDIRRTWGYGALVSPDGKLLAYSCHAGFALVDLASGKTVKGSARQSPGWLLAFSPDGRMIACSTSWIDGTIILIETATGKERRRFSGHQSAVNFLTFSGDGKLLLSCAQDATALVWDLVGSEEKEVPAFQTCWQDLGGSDAGRAYQAILQLARRADEAVPFLDQRLQAIPAVQEKQLARLIADLGSDQFAAREAATQELDRLGELAVAACRKALERNPSAEARRRLEEVVERYEQPAMVTSPERLRTLRALEALELAATPEARRVFVKLSGGANGAWLTKQAQAVLQRWAGPGKP